MAIEITGDSTLWLSLLRRIKSPVVSSVEMLVRQLIMENRYLEVLIFSYRGITAATIVTTTEGSVIKNKYDYHNNIKECCTGTTTAREKTLYKKKKKILVVDDEPDITSLFRKVLIKEGFGVDANNDAADTLENFKPHFYDLVILDIVMPKMDGFRLYNQLRKADPAIKILFLTASEKHLESLRKEGHRKDLFLTKPISNHDLLKEVNLRLSYK